MNITKKQKLEYLYDELEDMYIRRQAYNIDHNEENPYITEQIDILNAMIIDIGAKEIQRSETSVIDIVKDYLIKNDYDGLHNTWGECACEVNDLSPCSELSEQCIAGYKVPCDCGCHDWHIVSKKVANEDKNESL